MIQINSITIVLQFLVITITSSKAFIISSSSSTSKSHSFLTHPPRRIPKQSSSSSSSSSRRHLTTGPDGTPASSPEEDLELTRRIILDHLSKLEQVSTLDDDDDEDEDEKQHNDHLPENDLMIRAALGRESVERTPVWLFRQAGRHLPEYKEYKDRVGRNFLEMLQYPEDVAECTMQPLRRYDLDAAILFSDILIIPQELLNIEVTMPGGVGIQIPNPIQDPHVDLPSRDFPSVDEIKTASEDYMENGPIGRTVLESIRSIRSKMTEEGISVPLIGFSATPWTLMYYMVGGSSKKNVDIGKKWLKEWPKESKQMLELLSVIVVEYVVAQVKAGVHMVQLFEAMGMMVDEEGFYEFAMPCLDMIGREVKSRCGEDVPLMIFCRGAGYANEALSKLGHFDIITIDNTIPPENLPSIRSAINASSCGLQGNYDPRNLIDDGINTPETIREQVKDLLTKLGPQRYIANLGEGLGGRESPDLVKVFVDCVHEESEKMIAAANAAANAANAAE